MNTVLQYCCHGLAKYVFHQVMTFELMIKILVFWFGSVRPWAVTVFFWFESSFLAHIMQFWSTTTAFSKMKSTFHGCYSLGRIAFESACMRCLGTLRCCNGRILRDQSQISRPQLDGFVDLRCFGWSYLAQWNCRQSQLRCQIVYDKENYNFLDKSFFSLTKGSRAESSWSFVNAPTTGNTCASHTIADEHNIFQAFANLYILFINSFLYVYYESPTTTPLTYSRNSFSYGSIISWSILSNN